MRIENRGPKVLLLDRDGESPPVCLTLEEAEQLLHPARLRGAYLLARQHCPAYRALALPQLRDEVARLEKLEAEARVYDQMDR